LTAEIPKTGLVPVQFRLASQMSASDEIDLAIVWGEGDGQALVRRKRKDLADLPGFIAGFDGPPT